MRGLPGGSCRGSVRPLSKAGQADFRKIIEQLEALTRTDSLPVGETGSVFQITATSALNQG